MPTLEPQKLGVMIGPTLSLCELLNYWIKNRLTFGGLIELIITKLYKSPLEVGVPVIIVDTLCNLYSKLFYAVRWNGKLFAHFTVCSGVDRAAVSHAIFNVFTNVFIMQLKRQGIGCCISSMFLGCILYADDTTIESDCCRLTKDAR